MTGFTLVIIVIMKFRTGAWLTLLMIGAFVALMLKIKQHYTRTAEDLALNSMDEIRALINRGKSGRVILPVQSLNRSFIKVLNCALSYGFEEIELYNVTSSEAQALRLKEQVEALNIPGVHFTYDVTQYRNIEEVLLRHIEKAADGLGEHQHLTVLVGKLVVYRRFDRILHNRTSQHIITRLEKYRNVYVFQVPYII